MMKPISYNRIKYATDVMNDDEIVIKMAFNVSSNRNRKVE